MPHSPFTEEDTVKMQEAKAGLKQAREIISRAKLAGLPVGDQEVQLAEQEARLRSIEAAFFAPGTVARGRK